MSDRVGFRFHAIVNADRSSRGVRVRYLLIMCGQPAVSESRTELPTALPDVAVCGEWVAEMRRRGVLHSLVGLRPGSDATVVRARGSEVLLSDGPFAETKEQMGGVALIECADLDEAIEIASAHPAARLGLVEVRPVWEG